MLTWTELYDLVGIAIVAIVSALAFYRIRSKR